MIENLYHIYLKNKCIHHSLSKEQFEETMNQLFDADISYEKVSVSKEISLNSSY
jgi:hypothetical protein